MKNKSPPWRKIRKEIETIAPQCVVACSGGLDSVFLLDFVSRCKVKAVVAYFDHGLGNGSVDFCFNLAKRYNLPFVTDCGHGIGEAKSVEGEARKQRYAFLNRVREETHSEKILTAHHHDDQVETILLRLLRGYDHSTLGMKKLTHGVYRPFLEIPKKTILKQAKYLGLVWQEDMSNQDSSFERNYLRNEVLPILSKHHSADTIVKGLGK